MLELILECFISAILYLGECVGKNGCDVNANCVNVNGSYKCVCKNDYVGNGVVCSGKWLLIKLKLYQTNLHFVVYVGILPKVYSNQFFQFLISYDFGILSNSIGAF